MKYEIRTSPEKIENVEALSEEYKDHFLFENYKGDLAIGHIPTGLMMGDRNQIVSEYGKVNLENWKKHVDLVIELTEKNIQNTIDNSRAWNNPCGVIDSNYAPNGKIKDVLNQYSLQKP